MPVTGEGRRGILVCSDYPGATEDFKGYQFAGGAGSYLEDLFESAGVDLRRDCWLTNATICHDTHKRRPKTAVDDCRPNLLKTIRDLEPSTIILMGGLAVQSLIGTLWEDDVGPVSRWAGWRIPNHRPNCWIAPTFNPAHVLRAERDDRDPVTKMYFERHVRDALALEGRPWPEVPTGPPDYESQVEVVYDADEAAERIRAYRGGIVAVDLETSGLKPDSDRVEIVCCSVCFGGEETIAFPWHGSALAASARLMGDPDVAKIGYNCKFEDRFFRTKLGVETKGWVWDGMLVAHLLDPRPGITGLKFQAFCRLGAPDYSRHVKSFLAAKESGGNAVNRVREVGLRDLLLYCGVDSLLEYKVAQKQAEEMGVRL